MISICRFELLEIVFDSVYVNLQYDEISLTFTAGSMCLCGGCSPVVVIGLLLLLYALFNHPRLLIQVARVQKAQFSYRLDGLVP